MIQYIKKISTNELNFTLQIKTDKKSYTVGNLLNEFQPEGSKIINIGVKFIAIGPFMNHNYNEYSEIYHLNELDIEEYTTYWIDKLPQSLKKIYLTDYNDNLYNFIINLLNFERFYRENNANKWFNSIDIHHIDYGGGFPGHIDWNS